MGKVLEPWVSQQKLLGNKLVTKLAELFGTILGNLELFDYFMGECLLTFSFSFFPIEFMGNVYYS